MTTPSRTLTRTGLAAVATVAIATLAVSGTPTPAAAHAFLVDSTPEDEAAVDESPTEIVLEFNEPIQPDFTQVAILDADEQPLDLDEPEVDGPLVTQPVGELAPGTYQVNYRVGSADGHPVSGTITFTVTEAAAPSPTASPTTAQPTPATTAEPAAPDPTAEAPTGTPTTEPVATEEDTNAAVWLGGAAVAVAAGAAALFLLRRRLGQGGDVE
jgi:copper resistance protein C